MEKNCCAQNPILQPIPIVVINLFEILYFNSNFKSIGVQFTFGNCIPENRCQQIGTNAKRLGKTQGRSTAIKRHSCFSTTINRVIPYFFDPFDDFRVLLVYRHFAFLLESRFQYALTQQLVHRVHCGIVANSNLL